MPRKKTATAASTLPSGAELRALFRPIALAAAALPGVELSLSYGTPSLKLRGKMLVRVREDGENLVVRMDLASRDILLATQPRLFHITDHYRDYPAVLVRLKALTPARAREIVRDAWELVAPAALKAKASAPVPARKSSKKGGQDGA